MDNDAQTDVATGTGAGQPSRVKVYAGVAVTGSSAEPVAIQDSDPFGGAVLPDGVFAG